jgi:Protein of unknown function (DUF998)
VRTSAIVAIVGLSASAACVAVLHVVRSEVPPLARRLSEYAIGPHGWIMTTAFVALGCGLVALGFALLRERPRGPTWIVPAAGVLAGVGMIISAVYETGSSASSETIHSRASISATIAVVGLALVHSTPAARRWSDVPVDRTSLGLALVAAVLAGIAPLLHDTRWSGLGQRMLWIVLLIWLLRALVKQPSRRSGRSRRSLDPPRHAWTRHAEDADVE